MITETSEIGRDFNNLPLNDENILNGAALFYRNKHYTAGNRGHGLVELFTGFKFFKTVPCSEVSLVREKSKVNFVGEIQFTMQYRPSVNGKGLVGIIKEMPVISQGETVEELKQGIIEGIKAALQFDKENSSHELRSGAGEVKEIQLKFKLI